jgi:hypothetical protein
MRPVCSTGLCPNAARWGNAASWRSVTLREGGSVFSEPAGAGLLTLTNPLAVEGFTVYEDESDVVADFLAGGEGRLRPLVSEDADVSRLGSFDFKDGSQTQTFLYFSTGLGRNGAQPCLND